MELLLLLLAGELPLGGGCPRDCVCYPAPMTVCLKTSLLVGQTREPGVHPLPEEGSSARLVARRPPPPLVVLWE